MQGTQVSGSPHFTSGVTNDGWAQKCDGAEVDSIPADSKDMANMAEEAMEVFSGTTELLPEVGMEKAVVFPETISGETHVFPENYVIVGDVCPDLISGKTETFTAEQQDFGITFHEFNPANVASCEEIERGQGEADVLPESISGGTGVFPKIMSSACEPSEVINPYNHTQYGCSRKALMGCSFKGFCIFAPISWLNKNNGPVEMSQVLRITDFLVNRWGAVKKGNLQTIFFRDTELIGRTL